MKKHIKAHEEKMSWQTRLRKTHAEEFLARPNLQCSASTTRCSASLHMGLGSTGLDAHKAWAIFCQIEPQEMGTDGHCTVRLRTWGRNISPPATSLSPHSTSKHQTNCAQQRGKSNRKSGPTYSMLNITHVNTHTHTHTLLSLLLLD